MYVVSSTSNWMKFVNLLSRLVTRRCTSASMFLFASSSMGMYHFDSLVLPCLFCSTRNWICSYEKQNERAACARGGAAVRRSGARGEAERRRVGEASVSVKGTIGANRSGVRSAPRSHNLPCWRGDLFSLHTHEEENATPRVLVSTGYPGTLCTSRRRIPGRVMYLLYAVCLVPRSAEDLI